MERAKGEGEGNSRRLICVAPTAWVERLERRQGGSRGGEGGRGGGKEEGRRGEEKESRSRWPARVVEARRSKFWFLGSLSTGKLCYSSIQLVFYTLKCYRLRCPCSYTPLQANHLAFLSHAPIESRLGGGGAEITKTLPEQQTMYYTSGDRFVALQGRSVTAARPRPDSACDLGESF